jgi:leucyl/phenylalanyl-tRNA--protein transferase
MGSVFFGESMFSRKTDTSKIALIALCRQLNAWGYTILDCQVGNPHLFRMGAELISRTRFERLLQDRGGETNDAGSWRDRFAPDPRW